MWTTRGQISGSCKSSPLVRVNSTTFVLKGFAIFPLDRKGLG